MVCFFGVTVIERALIPVAGKSSWVDPRRADFVRVRVS